MVFWWQLEKSYSSTFGRFWGCRQGSPGDVKADFWAALSSIWSKRKYIIQGFPPVPGAGRGHPEPLDGHLGAKKVVSGSFHNFLGSGIVLWRQLEKVVFLDFCAFSGCRQGSPGGVKTDFWAVLSALWSKRKCIHEGFPLVPGADGGHPDPLGDRLGAKKPSPGHFTTFWGPGWCSGGNLKKSYFRLLCIFGMQSCIVKVQPVCSPV